MRRERNDLENVISVFEMQKAAVLDMYGSYFYTYFKTFFFEPERLSRKRNEIKALLSRISSGNNTLVMVDLGCGFGLESILLSVLADNLKIIGVDHNEEKIRNARKFANQAKAYGIEFILQKLKKQGLNIDKFDEN